MFGWFSKDQKKQPIIPPQRNVSPRAIDPSAYPRDGTCGLCFAFFLFLIFTPISIVCLYHIFPTTIVLLAGLWVIITLAPWAFHAGGAVTSDIAGPMLTVTLFMSVVLSFLGGVRCYYQHAQPMRQLQLAREYKGVYAQMPGVSFPDASYIKFAGNATVDVSKAVSYQSLDSGLSTYCVAPIKSSASAGRYDFWAIGVDCCGADGKTFDCYDAGDATVHSGWVLPRALGDQLYSTLGIYVAPFESRRDLFVKALKKAEALHGIATPGDGAVLMRWTKQSKESIVVYEMIQIIFSVLVFAAGMVGLSFFMTRLYQRFSYLRDMHHRQVHEDRRAGFATSDADIGEEDINARLHHFLENVMEGADDSDMAGTLDRAKGAMEKFRPQLSASDMCIMGVLLPYLCLMLTVIISTFSPCMRFGHLLQAPLWCMTSILILALLFTPSRFVTGLFILLCCVAGNYIGHLNYRENMFHYCGTSDRRLYKDVQAEDITSDYWDAGRLNFAETARLSTNHSVGFLYQGTTYCAAPVISTTAPCKDGAGLQHGSVAKSLLDVQDDDDDDGPDGKFAFMQRRTQRQRRSRRALSLARRGNEQRGICTKPQPLKAEFWAIGVNCCEPRKRFWCDGGEVKGAHEAVIVRAFGDEESDGPKIKSDRQHFFQAINQAVATYELPFPERPVLLRWGENSQTLQLEWRKRAVGVILMTGLASLLLILLIGISSFCWMKRARRLEKRNAEDYMRRQGGQAMEPTVYDSPRPSLGPADMTRQQQMDNQARNTGKRMSEDEMRF